MRLKLKEPGWYTQSFMTQDLGALVACRRHRASGSRRLGSASGRRASSSSSLGGAFKALSLKVWEPGWRAK